MAAKKVKLDPENPDMKYIEEAANILREGGLVIIPTETVYGIAANMNNKKTMQRLYQVKQRPENKPFSLHLDSKEKIEEFAEDIPAAAYKLIDKFWPGPLTVILNSKNKDKIGLRMPDNKVALEVIARAGVPVVCPSANLSGNPAAKDFQEAIKDLEGLVDFAIDAGAVRIGIESSIVDLTLKPIVVVREGAIKKEDILQSAQKKTVLFICTGNSCRSVMAKALLEKKLGEKKRSDVEVLSAGIMILGGLGASDETRAVLASEGIDVARHRSQRVTPEMIKRSDIILAMERLHEKRILEVDPNAKNKLFLLKEFAKINDNNLDIEDPIGKSESFYKNTFLTIKQSIESISDLI